MADVTPDTMNYASLVFGIVVIFSAVNYVIIGRKTFKPTLRKSD